MRAPDSITLAAATEVRRPACRSGWTTCDCESVRCGQESSRWCDEAKRNSRSSLQISRASEVAQQHDPGSGTATRTEILARSPPCSSAFIRLWRVTGEPPPCWGYTNLAIRLIFGHALFEIAAPVFGLRALGALVAQRVTHVPLRRQTHLTEQNHSTAKPYCTCMHVRTRQPRVAHSGPPQSVQTRPPLRSALHRQASASPTI